MLEVSHAKMNHPHEIKHVIKHVPKAYNVIDNLDSGPLCPSPQLSSQ